MFGSSRSSGDEGRINNSAIDISKINFSSGDEGGGYPGAAASRSKSEIKNTGSDTFLSVYDIDPVVKGLNSVVMTLTGAGAFHVGVELYGREWSYRNCGPDEPGIVCSKPRCHLAHIYRQSLPMGATPLSPSQVFELIERLQYDWSGEKYHLIFRNCIHFAQHLCSRLNVGTVPPWISKFAEKGMQIGRALSLDSATAPVDTPHPERKFTLEEVHQVVDSDSAPRVTSSSKFPPATKPVTIRVKKNGEDASRAQPKEPWMSEPLQVGGDDPGNMTSQVLFSSFFWSRKDEDNPRESEERTKTRQASRGLFDDYFGTWGTEQVPEKSQTVANSATTRGAISISGAEPSIGSSGGNSQSMKPRMGNPSNDNKYYGYRQLREREQQTFQQGAQESQQAHAAIPAGSRSQLTQESQRRSLHAHVSKTPNNPSGGQSKSFGSVWKHHLDWNDEVIPDHRKMKMEKAVSEHLDNESPKKDRGGRQQTTRQGNFWVTEL